MSRPKKRTKNGRLTKEAAEIVIEMLEEGVVQGKLRQADWCELESEFSWDDTSCNTPYRIGGAWYTENLAYYRINADPRDIIGFTRKADRKEFKRRWRERYPKEVKPETQVEAKSESEIKLTYPLFAKAWESGAIILFTSIDTGIRVATGGSNDRYGEFNECWIRATDTGHWQYLTFAEAEAEIFGEKK